MVRLAFVQDPQQRAGFLLCLSVSDSGDGIPPEILPRIFETIHARLKRDSASGRS